MYRPQIYRVALTLSLLPQPIPVAAMPPKLTGKHDKFFSQKPLVRYSMTTFDTSNLQPHEPKRPYLNNNSKNVIPNSNATATNAQSPSTTLTQQDTNVLNQIHTPTQLPQVSLISFWWNFKLSVQFSRDQQPIWSHSNAYTGRFWSTCWLLKHLLALESYVVVNKQTPSDYTIAIIALILTPAAKPALLNNTSSTHFIGQRNGMVLSWNDTTSQNWVLFISFAIDMDTRALYTLHLCPLLSLM